MGVSFFRETAPENFATFDRSFFAMCVIDGSVLWRGEINKMWFWLQTASKARNSAKRSRKHWIHRIMMGCQERQGPIRM